jgi:subtilisin family serine protease
MIALAESAGCPVPARIGLVDTQVAGDHPALLGRAIRQRDFASTPVPPAHGTAMAALLIGNGTRGHFGLVPEAGLHVGAVFGTSPDGVVSALSSDLVRALDWLVEQRVQVINMSLAGPSDPLLAEAVRAARERGALVVAAAGNDGPKAKPAYPGAIDGVLAVTAIDHRRRPFRQAARGRHIDFAAPGVELWAATLDGNGQRRSGTSIAAVHVTALAAIAQSLAGDADAAETMLRQRAVDLGRPGRDEVFGWGLARGVDLCAQIAARD